MGSCPSKFLHIRPIPCIVILSPSTFSSENILRKVHQFCSHTSTVLVFQHVSSIIHWKISYRSLLHNTIEYCKTTAHVGFISSGFLSAHAFHSHVIELLWLPTDLETYNFASPAMLHFWKNCHQMKIRIASRMRAKIGRFELNDFTFLTPKSASALTLSKFLERNFEKIRPFPLWTRWCLHKGKCTYHLVCTHRICRVLRQFVAVFGKKPRGWKD